MIDFTGIYSSVAMMLMVLIPIAIVFLLAFHLLAVKMFMKPTVNLFRRIQKLPLI